jgi:adenosylmethionine-8-amino-7-oxononanoate aminotransferase
MQDHADVPPLCIERGKGCTLTDTCGNTYIDGVSSLWTNVHGHCRPEIDQAVTDQLGRMAHSTLLGQTHAPAVDLAARLVDLAPAGLQRVFYSDSGSSAMEVALKIAFQYRQQTGERKRTRFMTISNAYHGDTLGAVSVGGIDLFHKIYQPLLFHAVQAPSPHCARCPFERNPTSCGMECLQEVERLMDRHGRELAAMVVEPLVQGAAGIVVHPRGFLAGVRDLCTRHGVLLIADEVAVGFGKTGTMFACEQEKVVPDIMSLAKGISGGYLPLAATLTTEEIFQGFLGAPEKLRTFFHGHTYTGNPLACAAGLASLDIFARDRVLETLPDRFDTLARELKPLAELENVFEIRRRGLMTGVELARPDGTPFPAGLRMAHRVVMEARRHGVILRPLGDVIVIMPPPAISTGEIETICRALYRSIVTVMRENA